MLRNSSKTSNYMKRTKKISRRRPKRWRMEKEGACWLSGKFVALRPEGRRFESYQL